MCFDERNTESRGRPLAPALTERRTRALRRSVEFLNLAIGLLRYFFLPSLRKLYSPSYVTPCPLLGAGGRNARISAATWPTFCLSMPVMRTSVGFGVAIAMPSGTG